MKVSMCIRVKYPVDRLHAMIFSLQRQTHADWEGIVTTDGPNPEAKKLVESMGDARLKLLETSEAKGFWGHPHRNLSIQACTGDIIGLTNDDNYYVPGYMECMLEGMTGNKLDMVLCHMVHSHHRWQLVETHVVIGGCDLGNWLVKAEIAKSTPWPGNDFFDDGRYVQTMSRKCRTGILPMPLFVKN